MKNMGKLSLLNMHYIHWKFSVCDIVYEARHDTTVTIQATVKIVIDKLYTLIINNNKKITRLVTNVSICRSFI